MPRGNLGDGSGLKAGVALQPLRAPQAALAVVWSSAAAIKSAKPSDCHACRPRRRAAPTLAFAAATRPHATLPPTERGARTRDQRRVVLPWTACER